MTATWVFDPAPPSGKRTGGSAAEYSFEGEIDSLVRESIQNSMDAFLVKDDPVRVRFRFIELTEGPLQAYKGGIA